MNMEQMQAPNQYAPQPMASGTTEQGPVFEEWKLLLTSILVVVFAAATIFYGTGRVDADGVTAEENTMVIQERAKRVVAQAHQDPGRMSTERIQMADPHQVVQIQKASNPSVTQTAAVSSPVEANQTQAATTSAGQAKDYVIKSGDTLERISKRAYGSIKYWKKIQQANNISDPTKIRAGQKISLPAIDDKAPTVDQAANSRPSAPRPKAQPKQPASQPSSGARIWVDPFEMTGGAQSI